MKSNRKGKRLLHVTPSESKHVKGVHFWTPPAVLQLRNYHESKTQVDQRPSGFVYVQTPKSKKRQLCDKRAQHQEHEGENSCSLTVQSCEIHSFVTSRKAVWCHVVTERGLHVFQSISSRAQATSTVVEILCVFEI